ncbi:hypothetical protein ACF3DV_24260 [Chlorogloeopsis fritschii PCC 9212]|uniref:Uncharacterized protein n=1 Tax=Chlorogloeopsis fritschii PCC 6912 TaxID=211165 RepID=A0A3S1FTV5_CHLFR|nr:hypothetical protein [Chlorogloeopsis fritschii]RUR85823.1 hypothetical protein PCC6912_06480 [Chlorogloeopsis fritschii PCC 6912]
MSKVFYECIGERWLVADSKNALKKTEIKKLQYEISYFDYHSPAIIMVLRANGVYLYCTVEAGGAGVAGEAGGENCDRPDRAIKVCGNGC